MGGGDVVQWGVYVGPVALRSKLEERKILNIIVVVNWRRGKR
jgi:hypothetical protein